MSSARGSGAGRTRGQAHQNTTAFRHNKNSKKTAAILATATSGGLCQRCADKLEWRKKYRKYKPLSKPRKCNACGECRVKAAYRTLCSDCAKARKACAQCGQCKVALNPMVQTKAEEAREQEFLEGVVEGMRERDRRTVYRKVARGEDVLGHLVESSEDGSDYGSDYGADDSSPDRESVGDDDNDCAPRRNSGRCEEVADISESRTSERRSRRFADSALEQHSSVQDIEVKNLSLDVQSMSCARGVGCG